ncbi:MAG TPA: Spy/CpxP family protein refolding chaperone [Patescibacteria group bacterium]|nr:Spy/CpxP family protein refolding chaperone [Patescibacteria group bacterium]
MMFRLTIPLTRALAAAALLGAVTLVGPADATTPAASTSAAQTDHVEKRISDLHGKLHITAEQEPRWTAVAQAMRDNAKNMDALIKERTANAKTMTAVEDLQSYEKLAAAHEDGLKTFIPLFSTLYDSLSDDQKKIADTIFRSHGPHHRHGKS